MTSLSYYAFRCALQLQSEKLNHLWVGQASRFVPFLVELEHLQNVREAQANLNLKD